MFLARVEGSVVATKKDDGLSGRKLLVRPQLDESDPAVSSRKKRHRCGGLRWSPGGELVMFTREFRPAGTKRPGGCRGGGHRGLRRCAWPSVYDARAAVRS